VRDHRTLYVEPPSGREEPGVGEHRREVVMEQQEVTGLPGRGDEPQRRPGDHGDLSEPGPDRVEQLGKTGG